MLRGKSVNARGELQIRVSTRNVSFTDLLCIMKTLPAAIFLAAWISWRVLWASARASRALWRAFASSAACVLESRSNDSYFLTSSWSSCWTSSTRASCFLPAARSLAALSSASANAFLRAATSVVAPNKVHDALVHTTHSFFQKYMRRLLHTSAVLQLLLYEAELFVGPLQDLLQAGDLRSMSGSSQQRRLRVHIDILC